MGDSPAPSAATNINDLINATKSLPDLMRIINSQITPSELAKFGASSVVSPGYANLQAQTYDTAGRQLNRTGQDIARENAFSNAQTDADVLRGPGQDIIQQVNAAQRGLDPSFYGVRDATGNALTSRISGGLTGSETTEIERALNKINSMQGTLDVPSSTTTTANALSYGQAGRGALDNALNQANTFLQTSRSGIDAFKVATGKTSAPNTGDSKFLGVTQPGGEANNLASNILGQAGAYNQTAAQINANRQGTAEKVVGSLPDY